MLRYFIKKRILTYVEMRFIYLLLITNLFPNRFSVISPRHVGRT